MLDYLSESGDPTEMARRARLQELNSEFGAAIVEAPEDPRKALEKLYGQVWNTDELSRDFTVIGFMAPLVVAIRKVDGVKGSLEFRHSPRFYFNFEPHKP